MAEISVAQLYKDTRRNLRLTWVAGLAGGSNTLTSETVTKPSLALIGHLNFVHPNRVQVLGCAEMDYLRSLDQRRTRPSPSVLYGSGQWSGPMAKNRGRNGSQHRMTIATPLFTPAAQSRLRVLSHYLAPLWRIISFNGVSGSAGIRCAVKGPGHRQERGAEIISRGSDGSRRYRGFFRIAPDRLEGFSSLLQVFSGARPGYPEYTRVTGTTR